MTGTLWHLFFACLAFTGGHVALSSAALRTPLVRALGARPFSGVYSLLMIGALVWMILAYGNAPEADVWIAHTAVKHLSLSLMPLATIFLAAGIMAPNPTLADSGLKALDDEPRGIFRVTRHPVMWGFGLWALLHLAGNGNAAGVLLFGSTALLALGGILHLDRRKRVELGAPWEAYMAKSSNLPFAAILARRNRFSAREIGWGPVIAGVVLYGVFLVFHEWAFGVAPVSLVSGLFD
jgi:uncharacterized membrane protein